MSKHGDFDDFLDDIEVKEWLEKARRGMFPKLKGSNLVLSLVAEEPDPKLCLETGAAVLFDKPIIAIAINGRKVPPGLRRIAHAVVEVKDMTSAESQRKIEEAIDAALQSRVDPGQEASGAQGYPPKEGRE